LICILRFDADRNITGWIIAVDTHDARRQADGAMDREMAQVLYRMEFTPQPGKYDLPNGCVMLVS
jgi:hypothetical protein